MTLSGDDIVEVSLLKPTGEEHGTSHTLKEEAALLGKEVKLPEVPGSLTEHPKIPRFVEHVKQITTPRASPPPSPQPYTILPRRQRSPGEGLMPTQKVQVSGSRLNCKRMTDCQNGGGNSDLSSALRMSTLVTSRSKGWPASKLQPSGCQTHRCVCKIHGSWSALPCLEVLGYRNYIPPKGFQENSRLSSGVAWRNGSTGHGTPEVHCPFWNASRGALQSSARALQMPCPCDWEWQTVWPQDVRCG